MTFPIQAGGRITAAAINSIPPVYAVKGANQDIASNTTLQNDNALFLPVAASTSYQFACLIGYEGGTLGSSDIQWEWAVPSGATMRYYYSFFGLGGGWDGAWASAGTNGAASSNGSGNGRPVYMNGTIIVAGTAGNVQFRWAQNTSNSTNTIVYAQSYLSLQEVLLT